jgi:cardiolipin synthase
MAEGFWPLLLMVGELLLRVALICVILLRRRPGSPTTLAWIVVILAVPVIGVVLYLLVGEVRLGDRRIKQHRDIVARIQSTLPFVAAAQEAMHPQLPDAYRPLSVLAQSVGDNDPLGGNVLKLLGDTDLFVESLVEDIDAAEHHVHLLTYIFLADHSGTRVAEALMRAARRGVTCRVLVDAVGSKLLLKSTLRRKMESAGVRVVAALAVHPLRMLLARIDLRNHRKIAVIDGVIGYTGSTNIADAAFAIKPKFAPWVDASVRVQGPVAWDLQILFIEDWFLDTNESLESLLHFQPLAVRDGVPAQLIGSGPNSYNEALRQLIHSAFHVAREELIMTTPYFVPDEATLSALCTAARRGVQTMIVLPAKNDSPLVAAASRSQYRMLLDAGVEIYEYQRGLLHAKTMTIDRSLAMLGSANLDRRSFELNFEVNLVVYDDDFAGQLRFLQRGYMEESRPVDRVSWHRRAWLPRLADNAAGTLSPLL